MPYGFRVLCALLGGLLLGAGLLLGINEIAARAYSGDGITTAAVASGVGLGLLATAFVPRD